MIIQRNTLLLVMSMFVLHGCATSTGVSASKEQLNLTVRSVVGTSLIGARGATPTDQDRIDDTVAGLCGARVWTKEECGAHDAAQ